MTFNQVRRATHDATRHGPFDDEWSFRRWTASRQMLVPSLGITAPISQSSSIDIICFHAEPLAHGDTLPGLEVRTPFRGRIGKELSLTNAIRRDEVEKEFGRIEATVTNLSQAISLIQELKPFSCLMKTNEEILYYRNRGIDFEFRSNVLTMFWVYPPQKKN